MGIFPHGKKNHLEKKEKKEKKFKIVHGNMSAMMKCLKCHCFFDYRSLEQHIHFGSSLNLILNIFRNTYMLLKKVYGMKRWKVSLETY